MAATTHSTTDIPTDGKCIRYDRETKDYACYLNGEFIGYAANYSAGEQLCNEVYYAQLSHTSAPPHQSRARESSRLTPAAPRGHITMPPFALDKRALALWLAVQAAARNDGAPTTCHRHRNRSALVWLDGAALCGDCAVKKLRCDTEKGGDAA